MQTKRFAAFYVAASMIAFAAPAMAQRADDARDETRAAMPVPPGVKIDWRVRNPFRFFSNPRDTELHRATWVSLTPEQRRTPVLSAERALASRHSEGWAAELEGKPCWNSSKNVHVCPDGKPYAHPDSHRIVAELKDFPDAEQHTCTWLTAPKARGAERGAGSEAD